MVHRFFVDLSPATAVGDRLVSVVGVGTPENKDGAASPACPEEKASGPSVPAAFAVRLLQVAICLTTPGLATSNSGMSCVVSGVQSERGASDQQLTKYNYDLDSAQKNFVTMVLLSAVAASVVLLGLCCFLLGRLSKTIPAKSIVCRDAEAQTEESRLSARRAAAGPKSGAASQRRPSRTVSTQSQTVYTWWRSEPRFLPLQFERHGAWLV